MKKILIGLLALSSLTAIGADHEATLSCSTGSGAYLMSVSVQAIDPENPFTYNINKSLEGEYINISKYHPETGKYAEQIRNTGKVPVTTYKYGQQGIEKSKVLDENNSIVVGRYNLDAGIYTLVGVVEASITVKKELQSYYYTDSKIEDVASVRVNYDGDTYYGNCSLKVYGE